MGKALNDHTYPCGAQLPDLGLDGCLGNDNVCMWNPLLWAIGEPLLFSWDLWTNPHLLLLKWSTIVQNPQLNSIACPITLLLQVSAHMGPRTSILHVYTSFKGVYHITCAIQQCVHAVSAVYSMPESQKEYLPVCYDQWWASHLVGSMANHTYPLSWKEARTLEQSVFSKSHMPIT